MTKPKYSQILDYILKLLSDFSEVAPEQYLSLPAILDNLQYQSSFGEAIDIGDYLSTKGYVTTINTIGDVLIQITPIGKLRVEKFDENTIKAYEAHEKETDESELLEVLSPPENPKAKVLSLIDNIKEEIIEKEGGKVDVVKDLEIIKLELSKSNPDLRIIMLKLEDSRHFSYALGKMRELRNYIAHAQ